MLSFPASLLRTLLRDFRRRLPASSPSSPPLGELLSLSLDRDLSLRAVPNDDVFSPSSKSEAASPLLLLLLLLLSRRCCRRSTPPVATVEDASLVMLLLMLLLLRRAAGGGAEGCDECVSGAVDVAG